MEFARRLVRRFRQHGIPLKAGRVAEDLGVPTVQPAGPRAAQRHRPAANKRLQKGYLRSKKVRQLNRFNKKTARLFQSGVLPMMDYRQEPGGWDPCNRKRVRAAAKNCCPPQGFRPRTTSLLARSLPTTDPRSPSRRAN